ncbi:MAG TPA: signal peptide peptidase SppA [Treponemataceae bacterium]|nr:signal peptide peptidase SppA [Treponemataceae bacterium]
MTIKEQNPKTKKKNTGLIILGFIVVLGIIFAISQCNTGKQEIAMQKTTSNRSTFWINLYKPDSIAILEINGTIEEANASYNQAWLLETLENLKNDKKNKALILEIDSPGGAVYQADELYLALKDYAKEKPLYAYFKSMAASGGYYIACAAEKIYANRNTLTGSIGVISGMSLDITEMLDKLGVKMTTVHSGKNKNMLNLNEPFTEEQRAIMQSVSDECYEQFTGIVAEARNLDIAFVKKLADGRIYTAKQALEAELIDGISLFEEALEELKSTYAFDPDIHTERLSYQKKKSVWESMLDIKSFLPSRKTEAEIILQILEPPVAFPAYYYAP